MRQFAEAILRTNKEFLYGDIILPVYFLKMWWKSQHHSLCCELYRVIQKDGINWTVNGASIHTRQLVAVFQVLCSLYGLTCVGYAQKSLEFVSRSPLIHVAGRSFCLYTDSLFIFIFPIISSIVLLHAMSRKLDRYNYTYVQLYVKSFIFQYFIEFYVVHIQTKQEFQ